MAGNKNRSRPHQPAFFQAKIRKIEMVNKTGLTLADPASMKFQFIKPPKKAATPTNAPRIRAIPINISPAMINFANQT